MSSSTPSSSSEKSGTSSLDTLTPSVSSTSSGDVDSLSSGYTYVTASDASLTEETETAETEYEGTSGETDDGAAPLELAMLTRSLEEDLKKKIAVKRLRRAFRSQIIEMVIYVLFLVIFSLVVLNARDPLYSYQMNAFMKDLFLYEEFPGEETKIYKTFFDVATWEEFWTYVRFPMLAALFDAPDVGLGRGYIYGQNYVVGKVRMRQVRVALGKCDIEDDFKAVFPECYARFKSSRVERGPHTVLAKPYYSSDQLGTHAQLARLQLFPGSGYIEEFSIADNMTVHEAHVDELIATDWVDLQTRVVFVDFTAYNANLNLFSINQMAFEFLPSGGVFPSYVFRVVRLYKYADTVLGRAQLAGEIILMFFVFCYLAQEIYEMWKHGCIEYWQNGWNVIDLLNGLLFLSVLGMRIALLVKLHDLDIDPTRTDKFYNFQPLSILNSAEQNVLAVNAFILWFKVFKYTKFLPGMDVIAETVSKSIRNTISFVFMMAFVFFGFAQAGVLAFGTDVPGFHTFIDTFFTLLRSLLGDFDFVAMQESNRVFGPLYFLTFIILVFFILLSMFMAILNDAYTEVQDSIRERRKGKVNLLHMFGDWIKDRTQIFQQQEEDADDLQEAFLAGDIDDDNVLDREEIEAVFQKYKKEAKQLLGITSADELLAEFDTDGDNLLSVEEQRNLLKNLQQRKVQAQVRKHELADDTDVDQQPQLLEGDEFDSEFSAYLTSVKRDLKRFHDRMSRMDALMRLVIERVDSGGSSSSSSSSSS